MLFLAFLITSYKSITLDVNNMMPLYGGITFDMAEDFAYQINNETNKDYYVYIDSIGGSVEAGNRIINEIQKYDLPCITHKAYSMAAAIFQGCNKRYIIPYGKLMFHNMTYAKNSNYFYQLEQEYIDTILRHTNLSRKELLQKMKKEWYIIGKNIIAFNLADEMVHVKCTPALTRKTTKNRKSMCPTIHSQNDNFRCTLLGC